MPALGLSLATPFPTARVSSGIAVNDPDAYDWVARVIANAGTVAGPTRTLVDTFCTSAKTHNYWTKINRVNLFAGDQLIACRVPLKVGGGGALEVNNGPFVAGDYTEATGLTGNGTSKYLDTNLNPGAALTSQDTHFGIYSRRGTADAGIHGTQLGATQTFTFTMPSATAVLVSEMYNTTNGAGHVEQTGITAPYGFFIGSRTSATAHAIYQNGTLKNSNAAGGGTISGGSVFIFALSNSGTPFGHNSGPLAGYTIGAGLTAQNVTDYTADMKAFQDGLARSVI